MLGLITSCQTPTKVYESSGDTTEPLVAAAKQPLKVEPTTIVFDARPRFEYAMYHLPQARPLTWKEFSQSKGELINGKLPQDLGKVARRFSRLGVSPDSKVVIIGKGGEGRGEEGRLAWTLFALGVHNVHFVRQNYFKLKRSLNKPPPIAPAPLWIPELNETVIVKREELVEAVEGKLGKIHLIDVRTKGEYFDREGMVKNSSKLLDLRALNINWKEFVGKKGRPNLKLRSKLKGVGVTPEDRIIVLSNNGVRSAAATMVLLSLGFSKAGNFAAGLESL